MPRGKDKGKERLHALLSHNNVSNRSRGTMQANRGSWQVLPATRPTWHH